MAAKKTHARTTTSAEIEAAIEVFVAGFSQGRCRNWPHEYVRVGPLWCLRDAPRNRAADYRKEEWIAYDIVPEVAHQTAKQNTRGRYFICTVVELGESADELRAQYKLLGYRLLATEPFFVHRLKRIPQFKSPVKIQVMKTAALAALLGKATRTRPISADQLANLPYRQYLAMENDNPVGWVRSVYTPLGNWCSHMYVQPEHRRRGIGKALLSRMLRDDRKLGVTWNVLLSSHTGAMLYPALGYEQIGMLYMFAPKKS